MNLKQYPEFIPVIEWWEKDGKKTVICLVAVLAVFAGYKGVKAHVASVKAAASDALVSAYTTEEMEKAVADFGGKTAGGVLKLRLAKSYYDAGNFEAALEQYEDAAKGELSGFEAIPVVGKAQCLEALGKTDEALAAFDAFAAENPNSYLTLTAQLGAARCLAAKGDKDGALERLAALKDTEDELAKARVEATEAVVKRFVAK